MPTRGGTPRRATHPRLGPPVGRHATTLPPVRPPRTVLQAIQRFDERRPLTHSLVRRPFGHVTGRAPVRRPRTVLQAVPRLARRAPTDSRVLRPFGHPTGRPPVRPLRVLRAWLARMAKRPLTSAKVFRPRGHITARPPIRRIRAVLARSMPIALRHGRSVLHGIRYPLLMLPAPPGVLRPIQRPRPIPRSKVLRPTRPVVITRHVRAIRVLGAAFPRSRFFSRVRRLRPFGRVTRNPPVRPPRVLLQAQEYLGSRRAITHSRVRVPKGHPTGRPPIRRLVVARTLPRVRPRTETFLRRVVRAFPSVIRLPKPIRVRLVAVPTALRRVAKRTRLFASKGHVTAKPPIRRPKVVRTIIRPRPPTHTLLRLARGSGVVVIPPHVRAIYVRLTRVIRSRFVNRSRLARPFGYRTRVPPVRRVLLARTHPRSRPRTRTFLGRVVRRFVPSLRMPRITVRFAAIGRRRVAKVTQLFRSRGYVTRKPPIRRASFARTHPRARPTTRVVLGRTVRIFVPPPPPAGGPAIIYLKESGRIAIRLVRSGKVYEEV